MSFDTEKPPTVRWGPAVTPGQAVRVPGATVGPDIMVDFTANPGAGRPFFDWLKDAESWSAFGDWYDTHADRYEHEVTP